MIKELNKTISLVILFSNIALNGYAGAPFLTDDPVPITLKHWEAFLFSDIIKSNLSDEEPQLAAPGLELNYGAMPNLQLHLITYYGWSLPGAAPPANGISDTEIGIKYRFIEETTSRPQMAFAPFIELPTGNANNRLGNGKTWYKIPFWLQKSFGKWTTYGGGGYVINPQEGMKNYAYGGWELQKQLNDKLILGAEIFSQQAISIDTPAYTLINAGGYYLINEHFNILFSAGHSIIGPTHLLGYIGFYWTGP